MPAFFERLLQALAVIHHVLRISKASVAQTQILFVNYFTGARPKPHAGYTEVKQEDGIEEVVEGKTDSRSDKGKTLSPLFAIYCEIKSP